MTGPRRADVTAGESPVVDALSHARRRAAAPAPRSGAAAVLGLQRAAGNEAVSALLLAKMRSPSKQSLTKLDAALREARRDEPAVDPLEDGLRAAKATGVHVDLEGIRPPPSALAVTTTGFGPGAVPAKKPVPPAKRVPSESPLGKAAGERAAKAGSKRTGRGAGKQAGNGAGRGAGPGPASGATAGGSAAGSVAPAPVDLFQPPVPPSAVLPDEDPAFVAVRSSVREFAQAKKNHPPAATKAAEAQDAALAPAGDVGAQAAAAKADTMDAQPAGSFDKKAFIAAVKTAIEAKSPRTLKEADDYKKSGKAKEVKGDVQGLVTQGKEGQTKDIAAATEAPPDTSKAVPKPVTPMGGEPPGAAAAIPAAGAVPKVAPPEQLNLEAGKHQASSEMAEGGVTEEQLAESGEPDFEQALVDKKEAAAHADRAPGEFRQQEQQVLAQTRAEAGATTTQGVAGMQGAKGAAMASLVADKGKAKTKDEQQRAQVTTKVQSIFDATEAAVTKILGGIDPKVEKEFDRGEKLARGRFENFVAVKMAAYKKDRYSGWTGKYRWFRDKIRGMPSKVNEFYVAGRELYLEQMNLTIARVADIVGKDLTAAKTRIATGKREIAIYVKGLPTNLKKVGAEASADIGDSFEQLESEVQSKQDSVVDTLATRYVTARKGLDERIEELQAANRGLVDKVVGAIKAIVNTIRELAAMLKNVLSRVAGVVGQIIKAPVKFLGNLIAGIKGGINRFKDNFVGHLRTGLMSWLFGALAEGGVELPDSFDIKGVIKLLSSIFGLTWRGIRDRIVKQIGAKAMAAAESGVGIFQKLAAGGVGELWEMLLEKLGDIKEMILGKVKDFVLTKIVTAGITWLISLLNPAAAFIKACKLIYDVVMFFVNNASRIARFVNTIIDSVADIVRGNVGGVAAKIENVLGQMLPLIIGFLASVIGLGGVGAKVREIVQKLRRPVTRALDSVIATGLKLAAPLIRGIKGVSGRVKARVAAGKAWVKGRATAGKKWVKERIDSAGEHLRGAGPRGSIPDRLRSAVQSADSLMSRAGATTESVRRGLPSIRDRLGLASLDLLDAGGHNWRVMARINPELPSDSRKIPSPAEMAAVRSQCQDIAVLWRINGVAAPFKRAGRERQRTMLLDPESYRRPGGRQDAPTVSVGDLVEAMAEPGLRRIAAATGATLVVRPEIFFCDVNNELLGGRIDELDFLLLGETDVRVVSAKTQRTQFARAVDERKLALLQQVPDNRGSFGFVRSWMNWGPNVRRAEAGRAVGVLVRHDGGSLVRVSDFRSRFLGHEQTRRIVIEPVHPKHQGEDPSQGHQLRVDLPDLVEIYVAELRRSV